MLKVFKETASGKEWYAYSRCDELGRVALTADTAAVLGYDQQYGDLLHFVSGNLQFLSDTDGRVARYDYGSTTSATATTAGDVSGYRRATWLSHGETDSSPDLMESWNYFTRSVTGVNSTTVTIHPLASHAVYPDEDTSDLGSATARRELYSYTWHAGAGALQVLSVSVQSPSVSAGQNGSGSADATATVLDTDGRAVWSRDAAGFLRYFAYDEATGAMTKEIVDVDTALTASFVGLPSGWATPTGGGLHLVSTFENDIYGRLLATHYPNGNADYMTYDDAKLEVRVYRGWQGSAPTGPVEVIRQDRVGGPVTVGGVTRNYNYTERLTMAPAAVGVASGRPTGTEAVSNVQSLTRDYFNQAGQLAWSDVYFKLDGLDYYGIDGKPAFTLGLVNVNFYRVQYSYDHRGRNNRVVDAEGTVTRTDFDALGRATAVWVGTDDTLATGNMTRLRSFEYDGGNVGIGNLTRSTAYPGGGTADRVTAMTYDWRGRLVAAKAGVQNSEGDDNRPLTYLRYNNLGQVTSERLYDGDYVTILAPHGVPVEPDAYRMRGRTDYEYDDRGRVFRTEVYSVDPGNGDVSANALTSDIWYDRRGMVAKASAPGGLVQKYAYDGAGRLVLAATGDGGGDTTWADAINLNGDTVLEQSEYVYDDNSNLIETATRQRFHDATGTGALGTPTNGVAARVYHSATYYDALDRTVASANFGTSGGAVFTRPATVPTRSDTVLVTSVDYDEAGRVRSVTDPRGIASRTEYDAMGRTVKSVANYTDGVVTNSSNATTIYEYDGSSHLTALTVDLPGTAVQRTEYVYGVTAAGGNGIASNGLLAEVRHPDAATGLASAGEAGSYTYNSLGELLTSTDRNGTTHTFDRDVVGRTVADRVTTLGAGVDGAVRRLEIGYNTQGLASTYTSFDAATGGTVVNQVQRAFNGLGQMTSEWQAHDGASIGWSGTLQVNCAYREMAGGANDSRLLQINYPNWHGVTYSYGATGGLNDRIGRVEAIVEGSTTDESYSYLGLGTVVQKDHPSLANYRETLIGTAADAGDQYAGLDRFGRLVRQKFVRNADNAVLADLSYGYDRDGNRLWKNDAVLTDRSVVYSCDGLNQMTGWQKGVLNSAKDGIVGAATGTQSWQTDGTGNFTFVTTNGTAEARTHNSQNELTGIGGASLGYDENGNRTLGADSRTLVYDAWNRLVEIRDGGTTEVRFEYDALNRRIEEAAGGVTKDMFYSASWQLLEVREDGIVMEHYVWGTQYVDGLVLRNRDADGISTNGVLGLEQTHYALQDASSNVVAIADYGGVTERYDYTAYGMQTVLDAAGVAKIGGSDVGWVVGHQGLFFVEAAGFYANRERFYDPQAMRFVNQDPLGFGGGDVNVYRYVGNGPANGLDSSGLILPFLARAGVGGLIGVGLNGAANLSRGDGFLKGAGGAVGGSLFGPARSLAGGLGLLGSASFGAAMAGLAGYLAERTANDEPITLEGAAVSTALGALFGPVCEKVAPRLLRFFGGRPAAGAAPAAVLNPITGAPGTTQTVKAASLRAGRGDLNEKTLDYFRTLTSDKLRTGFPSDEIVVDTNGAAHGGNHRIRVLAERGETVTVNISAFQGADKGPILNATTFRSIFN